LVATLRPPRPTLPTPPTPTPYPTQPEEAEEWADEDNRRGRKGKGRKFRVTTLTIDQKLDIVTAELDAVKKEATAFDLQSSRMIDALKAMLEQTDLRIASLKREAYEFKRDVVIAGANPRTGKPMAEKATKYFEDQMRAKDSTIDKLRLKNGTLRVALAKLEASLKQKDEVGDVLHYIDFHQLQIENKQYLAKIEEKNAELLRLKLSTGQTIQTLNAMKMKLGDVAKETTRLRTEIKARAALLTRLRVDNAALAASIAESQELGAALARGVRESSDMPTIMDYVELKALQTSLTKDAASWDRKMEIMELTARQTLLKSGVIGAAAAAALSDAAAASLRRTTRPPSGGAGMGGATTMAGGSAAAGMAAASHHRGAAVPSSLGYTSTAGRSRTPGSAGGGADWRAGATAPPSSIVGPKGVGGFGGRSGSAGGGVLRLGAPRSIVATPAGGGGGGGAAAAAAAASTGGGAGRPVKTPTVAPRAAATMGRR